MKSFDLGQESNFEIMIFSCSRKGLSQKKRIKDENEEWSKEEKKRRIKEIKMRRRIKEKRTRKEITKKRSKEGVKHEKLGKA